MEMPDKVCANITQKSILYQVGYESYTTGKAGGLKDPEPLKAVKKTGTT